MDQLPLGDYEQFEQWSGQSLTWGPEGAGWRAWFGGKVVDGLCEILDRHLSAERPRRSEGQPVVIGCVPWLTSDEVIDRLLRLAACCIVLDKGARLPTRLVTHDRPFPSSVLPRLAMTMPAVDGAATVLGPYGPMPDHEVGPVRVLGWQGKGMKKPLLHAKILVLGDVGHNTYEADGVGEWEEWEFTPHSVWWGSANWTRGSRSHLEVGFWSDDDSLTRHASSFVQDVISFSEPVDSLTAGPEPNLLPVEFDDEAMREAWEAGYLDHLAAEEDDDQA